MKFFQSHFTSGGSGVVVIGGAVSATRWRLYFQEVQTGTSVIIGELAVRESSGGSNIISSATLTASSTSSTNVVGNIRDGSATTGWISGSGVVLGEYIEMTFATAKTIRELVMTAGNTGGSFEYNSAPLRMLIQYFDTTWKTAWGWAGLYSTNAEVKTITGSVSGAKRYWRVTTILNQSSGTFHGMSELELRATVSGLDQATGGTPSATLISSGTAASAFDDNLTTYLSQTGSNGGSVTYDFGSGNNKTVNEIGIGSAAAQTRSLNVGLLQSSSDGVTWEAEYPFKAATFVVPSLQVFARPT
jgi:hypothetical protein